MERAVIKITDKLVITGTDHESIGTILFFIVSFVRPCRSKMHPEGFFHEKNRYLHPLAFSVQLSGEPDCNTESVNANAPLSIFFSPLYYKCRCSIMLHNLDLTLLI